MRSFSSILFCRSIFFGRPTNIYISDGLVAIFYGFWPMKIDYILVVKPAGQVMAARPGRPCGDGAARLRRKMDVHCSFDYTLDDRRGCEGLTQLPRRRAGWQGCRRLDDSAWESRSRDDAWALDGDVRGGETTLAWAMKGGGGGGR
jgi:hypothetical protein